MNAWVTLLTHPSYLVGVRALRASLEISGTQHPLVVLLTDDIDAVGRQILRDDGCLLRDVELLQPASDLKACYAYGRFAHVWTKLLAWTLTDYDRVVFLDADMLVTKNMDELFSLDLPTHTIAASHACRCNPNRVASYPASWTPASCFYTYCRGFEHISEPEVVDNYLNSGLLVLTPDSAVFEQMVQKLMQVDDLTCYPFADQDFLNEFYEGRWVPLPYIYNALKTLALQHASLWDLADVKNIHFIMDKPWQASLDEDDMYFVVNRLWWQVASALPQPPQAITN